MALPTSTSPYREYIANMYIYIYIYIYTSVDPSLYSDGVKVDMVVKWIGSLSWPYPKFESLELISKIDHNCGHYRIVGTIDCGHCRRAPTVATIELCTLSEGGHYRRNPIVGTIGG